MRKIRINLELAGDAKENEANMAIEQETSFPCPAGRCQNCRTNQAKKNPKALRRLRQCGSYGKEFYTEEKTFGPERYICDHVPGLRRGTIEYENRRDQYQMLLALITANPNSREATELRIALENARRRCGIEAD